MIIKKKQLLIDAPCVIGRKETKDSGANNLLDPSAVAKILEEANTKASEIVKRAESEASKILSEAEEKRRKILQEIEAERQRFRKYVAESSQRLATLISNFQKQLDQSREELLKELVEVIRVLIEKIAFKSLDEVDFQQKMRKIFSKLSEVKSAKVFLNEKDADSFPEIVKQCESMGFDVVKSESLEPGEVLVETELGVLDGTRRTVAAMVEKLLEEVFGPAGTEGVSQAVQGEAR